MKSVVGSQVDDGMVVYSLQLSQKRRASHKGHNMPCTRTCALPLAYRRWIRTANFSWSASSFLDCFYFSFHPWSTSYLFAGVCDFMSGFISVCFGLLVDLLKDRLPKSGSFARDPQEQVSHPARPLIYVASRPSTPSPIWRIPFQQDDTIQNNPNHPTDPTG